MSERAGRSGTYVLEEPLNLLHVPPCDFSDAEIHVGHGDATQAREDKARLGAKVGAIIHVGEGEYRDPDGYL